MKVFKWILITVLVLAIAFGIIVVSLGLGYPQDLAFRWAAYFLAAVFGFFILRRILNRWRAKQRAKKLLDLEEREPSLWSSLGFSRDADQDRFRILQKTLRKRIGRGGEYHVPWFIELECDTGDFRRYLKQNSNNVALDLSPDISSGSAIDIDIVDSFLCLSCSKEITNQEDGGSTWRNLLEGLSKYRDQQPVDGVIVSLPVQFLLESEDQVTDTGRSVNELIQNAMRTFRMQIPVFLVVTDLWRIDGFEPFTALLSEREKEQALGLGFGRNDQQLFEMDEGFAQFSRQLCGNLLRVIESKIALNVTEVTDQNVSNAALMRLAAEIGRLQRGVELLVKSVSGSILQKVRPSFRGVYLLSFPPRTNANDQASADQSVFSSELLRKILPKESGASTTLEFAERLFIGARRKVFSRISIIWILIVGVVLLEGALDLQSMELVRKDSIALSPAKVADYQINTLNQLDHKRKIISRLESQANSYDLPPLPIPWLGIPPDKEKISEMKRQWVVLATKILKEIDLQYVDYVRAVKKEYLLALPAEKTRAENSPGLDERPMTPFSKFGLAMTNALSRIQVLRAIEYGNSHRDILSLPNPFSEDSAYEITKDDPDLATQMFDTFVYAKLWSKSFPDLSSIEDDRSNWTTKAENLISKLDPDMTWLMYAANDHILKDTPLISTGDLWPEFPPSKVMILSPVWTDLGIAYFDEFFGVIRNSGLRGEWLDTAETNFKKAYAKRRIVLWEDYANTVLKGNDQLVTRSAALGNVIEMASSRRNPYRNALRLIGSGNKDSYFPDNRPDWLNLALFHEKIELLGGDEEGGGPSKTLTKLGLKLVGKFGGVGKAVSKAGKKGLKTKKKLDKEKGAPDRDEQLDAAAKVYKEKYLPALAAIAFSADSRDTSFQTITSRFESGDDPSAGGTPLAAGYKASRSMEMMLGLKDKYNYIYWDLLQASLRDAQVFMLEEASCKADAIWQEEVRAAMDNVPISARFGRMFNDGGLAWTYVDTHLKPFVKTAPGVGLMPRKVGNLTLDLGQNFFDFLSYGRLGLQGMKETFTTPIMVKPVTVNKQSLLKPLKTSMILSCDGGKTKQTIVNQNFETQGRFEWSQACSDLRLDIDFGIFTLRKVYPGVTGYPDFLKGFDGNVLSLTNTDFPEYKNVFKQQRISQIDLNYEIVGKDQLINAAKQRPVDTPPHISSCWPVVSQGKKSN